MIQWNRVYTCIGGASDDLVFKNYTLLDWLKIALPRKSENAIKKMFKNSKEIEVVAFLWQHRFHIVKV